jgi:hypothetical protein
VIAAVAYARTEVSKIDLANAPTSSVFGGHTYKNLSLIVPVMAVCDAWVAEEQAYARDVAALPEAERDARVKVRRPLV